MKGYEALAAAVAAEGTEVTFGLLGDGNMLFQTVLTDIRKEKAVRLLLGTTLPLDEIAEQLGYSDQTNFSHAFRQWSGFTPGQYRKHSR